MRGLVLLGLLGLLAVGMLLLLQPRGGRAAEIEAGSPHAVTSTVREELAAVGEAPHRARSEAPVEAGLPPAEEADPAPAAKATAVFEVRGQVVDPGALPLAGVTVALKSSGVEAKSDGGGRFVLDVPGGIPGGSLVVDDEDYASVRPSRLQVGDFEAEHVIVALPAIRLGGFVRDETGGVVPHASIRLDVDDAYEREFPYPLDRNTMPRYYASSAEDGSYSMRHVPATLGAFVCRLNVTADGYETAAIEVPTVSNETFDVILTRATASPMLRGTVLYPEGDPAADATVRFGMETAETSEDGIFALATGGWFEDETPLVAGHPDYGAAILPGAGRLVRDALPGEPAPVTIVLAETSQAIEGWVLDANGTPLRNWQVDLVDAEIIVPGLYPPITLENFQSGSERIQTNAIGRFRIEHLQDRPYTLRAYNPNTLVSAIVENVEAGRDDVVIRVPPDATIPRVRGVVVGGDGNPVEKAQVSVGFFLYRSERGSSSTSLGAVQTDAQGTFELRNVPRERVFLSVGGASVVPTSMELTGEENPDAVVIEVQRRRRFRLRLEANDLSKLTFAVRDEGGSELAVYRFQGNGFTSFSRCPLQGATTAIYGVGELGHTLVVYRDGEEILKQPIRLSADEVVEIALELP